MWVKKQQWNRRETTDGSKYGKEYAKAICCHLPYLTYMQSTSWAMPCRSIQDGWVMVESSDKMWSTGERNGKLPQYSCLENPMNSMKRQKDRTLKDELPRSIDAQYATADQWEITPERMNRWSQSKSNTQLWMWLVMEAKSDAVNSNIA